MNRKQLPLAVVLLLDLLLTGVILLVFAFFHHVLPALTAKPAPVPLETIPPHLTPAPLPTETPDDRSPWQIRFEEHFSDEVEVSPNSYKSENVSIEISTVNAQTSNGSPVVYHVADIYIGDISCFATATANNELKYFSTQDVEEIDAAAEALLSISGDFYCYQQTGFLMRNGELYRNDQAYCDICVLFDDGRLACYSAGEYTNEELMAQGAVQVWNFGPSLLDENGHAKPYYNVSTTVGYPNPRSAIGYYEPGHYCFVVVDGRQENSVGLLIDELAAVFEGLGCKCAYNLDGGGSAVMMFNHERFSNQSNGANRELGDILLIRESESAK